MAKIISSDSVDSNYGIVPHSGAAVDNTAVTNISPVTILTGTAGADFLAGTGVVNLIYGLAGDDMIVSGPNADTLVGGLGNDTYYISNSADVIAENLSEGTDVVNSSVSFVLPANVETLNLTGTAIINGTANNQGDTLNGNSAGNILTGGQGADILNGGGGTDTLYGGGGADTLTVTGVGNDFLYGGAGNDVLNASTATGNNYLDGGAGADSMVGGPGNNTFVVDNTGDTVTELSSAGTDTVLSSVSYTLGANLENLTLTGTGDINGTGNGLGNTIIGNDGSNNLNAGGAGNATLRGGGGVDTLTGGAGNDILDSQTGNDSLIGGAGNDSYYVNSPLTTVTELASGGTDQVFSTVSYTVPANVEILTLLGTAFSGTANNAGNTIIGNAGINLLTGGTGNDYLDGGAGLDVMIGGTGNDSYVVDNTQDVVSEAPSGGTDTVLSWITYSLTPGNPAGDPAPTTTDVENLTLLGTANINGTANNNGNALTGNTGSNILTGGTGADTLYGGGGADTLIGGLGNDTYIIDSTSTAVTISETATGGGTDTVLSTLTYTLPTNVENLTLNGTANLNGTGNSGNNVITGNSGNNTLYGGVGGGTDTLIGGNGNDTYIVDASSTALTISETATGGTDIVLSSATNFTLAANVENLTLTGAGTINGTGNTGNNILVGNGANNLLDGGAGADSLSGGLGNDTYVVDNSGDTVTEAGGAGTDLVQSSVTFTLPVNVENLTLTGAGNINGSGNTGNNTITGNAGNNVLYGAGGTDILAGGDGNDTYNIDSTSTAVTISETGTGGTDTVLSSVSYTLAVNLENLVLTGFGVINGTGNSGNNTITGNAANNILYGGAGGTDTLIGGSGNDTYIVDATSTALTLSEAANGGTDTVQSSISYTLGANFENLTLTGTGAISGTGNAGNNLITGNTGADTLYGAGGTDTLAGGDGNDTYTIDTTSTAVTLVETATGGTDTVQSSINFTLPTNFENLTLTGTGVINGTGNNQSNTIIGNIATNVLNDGGSGAADSLSGGDGNDTYYVNNASDTITETSTGGTDQVISSVTYTLSANVENLTLAGTGVNPINGTGNSSNNILIGNDGNNTLVGGGGADKLQGAGGVDTLTGSGGNDTFVYTSQLDTGLNLGNRDIITNFTPASDKIDVSQLPDSLGGTGNWLFVAAFDATSKAEIRFDKVTDPSHPVVAFDSNGDGTTDFQIELTGVSTLAVTDFIGAH